MTDPATPENPDQKIGDPRLQAVTTDTFSFVILTDGTHTQAEVMVRETAQSPWRQLGFGSSRRRKGEKRNPDVGFNLAMARAFQDAADRAAEGCVQQGFPAFPKPVVQPAQWLDNRALDVALRHWMALSDYDHHKTLENPEDGSEDQYPGEVRDFARYYRMAVKGELTRETGDDEQ